MELSSLNELDFNEAGEWPLLFKLLAAIVICSVIWGGGYYFLIQDQQTSLKALASKEATLKKEITTKYLRSANLEDYKEQFVEMELRLASMLKQLPKEKEVAALLIDISRTGLINGLVFELFKPEAENEKGFYAELPITMKVTGSYHQFGDFFSGLAELPRIVTVHNFSVSPLKGNGAMVMELTAKTYRYFEADNEN